MVANWPCTQTGAGSEVVRWDRQILGVTRRPGNAKMVREPFSRRHSRSEGSENTRLAAGRLRLYHLKSSGAGLDNAVCVWRPRKGGVGLTIGRRLQVGLKAKQQEVILKPIGAGKRVIAAGNAKDVSAPISRCAWRRDPSPAS
jgi:hypothetical protein